MVQRHPKRSDQEWMELIQECRTSGLTDKAWCERNHIQRSSLYYHIRRFRNMACEIPDNLHIAKLNGRLCGAKRPHSVSEQPNFYQSLQSNPYNDSSHPSGGE